MYYYSCQWCGINAWENGLIDAAGITSGIGGGKFGPNGTLTRQEMATFIYRTLMYVKNNSDIKYTIYGSKLGDYSDSSRLANWSKEPWPL